MFQGTLNCLLFLRRTMGNNGFFFFGRVVVDPDRKIEGTLGLGNLQARHLETEVLQDVILDLRIGRVLT